MWKACRRERLLKQIGGAKVQKKILVIDDDKDIVKLITKSLSYEGFETISAYSGKKPYVY